MKNIFQSSSEVMHKVACTRRTNVPDKENHCSLPLRASGRAASPELPGRETSVWPCQCQTRGSGTGSSCSPVAQFRSALCAATDCSTPGFPQTHVHWVSDAIQPSHPLSPPSPPALNSLQHQSLFQWVSSLHQVAKVLELQLQHQSFHWIIRIGFL